MVDVFDKAKRSEVMSRIRGRGNRDTEVLLAKLMRRSRITGWRRHQLIPGKPDFVFRAARLAVFVDGCFWHGCPRHCHMPATNRAFWYRKLEANKARDHKVNRELRGKGWRVLRVWEHEMTKPERVLHRLKAALGPLAGESRKARGGDGTTPQLR